MEPVLEETFHSEGFLILSEIIPREAIDTIRCKALSNFDELQSIIDSKALPFGIGTKQVYTSNRHCIALNLYIMYITMRSLFLNRVSMK